MEGDIIQLQIGLRRAQSELSRLLHKLLRINKTEIDSSWISVLLLINAEKEVSVKIIAGTLALTHPAVVQLLNKMEINQLVSTAKSEADGRVKLVSLTETGKKLVNELQVINGLIQDHLNKIDSRLSAELLLQLKYLSGLVRSSSFTGSLVLKLKEIQLKKVRVTTFKPEFVKYFRELNYDSLKRSNDISKEDEHIFADPENEIIKKGGEVFFAFLGDEIVGTCAVLKHNKSIYELSKMAVKESARGRQAGKKLALAAIGFAASNNADSMIVYVDKIPESAFRLFESLGFTITNEEPLPGKKRSELIKMQLTLI